MKTPATFVEALADIDLPNTFNPYRNVCPTHDTPSAARTRRVNLERCLQSAADARTDTIWVARDLGYRGGRRTGIPLTDEAHLVDAAILFGGVDLERATHGPIVSERTATVTWDLLAAIGRPVMLWNVFPLHPHEPGAPMTNRRHRRAEREITWCFMSALVEMLGANRLVAIGRDAAAALESIDVPVTAVRHPSYGGQTEFAAGIRSVYGLPAPIKTVQQLPFAGFV